VDAELQIGNDPATWYFAPTGYDKVAAGLGQPGAPFAIDVIAPLQGRLLLHPQAAGKVALTLPLSPVGWNPSGVCWPKSPLLYVSSATGPTHANPGYTLARGYQLAALEEEILTAMAQGGIVTVMLDEGLGKGMLSLSGATLPYAVLCPPTAAPTAAG
jgi:hypothetical protein